MKTLRLIGMALLAVVLSVNLAACSSDDDDDDNGFGLAGTTWEITSSSEDDEMVGLEITFNANGTCKMSVDAWSYMAWSLEKDVLTLTVGEGYADDYMTGSISVSGKNATYTYHWGDVNGKWTDDETNTMTLTRK